VRVETSIHEPQIAVCAILHAFDIASIFLKCPRDNSAFWRESCRVCELCNMLLISVELSATQL
jgi:hypothetical protein